MFSSIRNKESVWWRILNQPLSSDLPRFKVWISLIGGIFFLAMIVVLNIHVHSTSYQTMFETEKAVGISSIHIVFAIIILFDIVLDIAFLFFPSSGILQNRLMNWGWKEKIRQFSVMGAVITFLFTGFIALMAFAIVPTLNWQYDALKKDQVILAAIKDKGFPLEQKWLKVRDISMQQYAQRRQDVLDDGLERHSEVIALLKEETLFLIIFFAVLLFAMVLKTITDIYYVWRYRPHQKL